MAFDLEAEVRDLAARRDIMDALHRYMRGQDRLDPVLHRSAFHDDAWVDCGPMAGTADEFVAFAQGLLGDFVASQHILCQVQVSVDGDTGSGEAYFYAWHRIVQEGEPKDLIVAGRYIDEYVCRDGDWRIRRRREIVDWARTDPIADEFMANTPLVLAGRHGTDFSQTRDWPV